MPGGWLLPPASTNHRTGDCEQDNNHEGGQPTEPHRRRRLNSDQHGDNTQLNIVLEEMPEQTRAYRPWLNLQLIENWANKLN